MDDNRKIHIDNKEYKKFENFWYYNKWKVIIGIFLLITVFICTFQACNKEKYDVDIIYAGSEFLDPESRAELSSTLSAALPEDLDDDGEKKTALTVYQIYSKEEITKIEQTPNLDGSKNIVDKAQNSSNMNSFNSYVMTGETAVCFLSDFLYENLKENERLLSLSEIFEVIPEGAIDEYGIRLSSTDLYKYNSSVKALGDNTVLCFLKQPIVGKMSDDEEYKKALQVFQAFVEFSVKAE